MKIQNIFMARILNFIEKYKSPAKNFKINRFFKNQVQIRIQCEIWTRDHVLNVFFNRIEKWVKTPKIPGFMIKNPIWTKINIIFGFLILIYPRIDFNNKFLLKVQKTPKMPGEIKIRVLNDGIFEFGFQIRNLRVRF